MRFSCFLIVMGSTSSNVDATVGNVSAPVNQSQQTDESYIEFPLVCKSGESHQTQELTSFLKVTYNLNPEFSKFVAVGLFKEFGYKVGILFYKQGMRKWVMLDQAQFINFQEQIYPISFSICNDVKKRRFDVTGFDVVIRRIIGKRYVEIRDLNHDSIILNNSEWDSFVKWLPCINRYIDQLSLVEDSLIEHITRILHSDRVYIPPPQLVNGWDADRLFDEVTMYKMNRPMKIIQ